MPGVARFWRKARHGSFEWGLWLAPLILMAIGLAVLYGTSLSGQSNSLPLYAKQLLWIVIGLLLGGVVAAVDYRFWKHLTFVMYVGSIVLLIGVLLFGTIIQGHKSWFVFGGVSFQPVEWVKVALVITLSHFFAATNAFRRRWWPAIASLLLVGIIVWLVLRQPDLGSSIVLISVWLALLIARGLPTKQVVVFSTLAVIIALSGWYGFLRDYQKQRIVSFINPAADSRGAGYNVTQSTIAVGSGGLLGKGIGQGTQSQLRFLPVRTTDFIFAVVGEEMGFVGSLAVIALYGWLLWRLLVIARNAVDDFGGFLATGVAAMFFAHGFINIGMNIGLVPVTGIPLPFVSYGGSSLTAYLIAIGLVQSVARVKAFGVKA
ncbi:MAG: rod shape-determining protein RodA [bacterium]